MSWRLFTARRRRETGLAPADTQAVSTGEVSRRMRGEEEESCVILSLPLVSGRMMGRKNPAMCQVHQDQESWCPFSLWCTCEHYSWCLWTCGACNRQKSKLETNLVWFKSHYRGNFWKVLSVNVVFMGIKPRGKHTWPLSILPEKEHQTNLWPLSQTGEAKWAEISSCSSVLPGLAAVHCPLPESCCAVWCNVSVQIPDGLG